jgi:hypothetical protein
MVIGSRRSPCGMLCSADGEGCPEHGERDPGYELRGWPGQVSVHQNRRHENRRSPCGQRWGGSERGERIELDTSARPMYVWGQNRAVKPTSGFR